MITEFKLSEKEIELAKKFEDEHLQCARNHPTTIGGHIDYTFTPTSIGIAVSIHCCLCDKSENITDYGKW